MNHKDNIFEATESYLEEFQVEKSAEELFCEFEMLVQLHEDFDRYLNENKFNSKLETMKRSERLLAKRKLFVNWYSERNQNNQLTKDMFINLSEMTFVSQRTLYNDISNETTA